MTMNRWIRMIMMMTMLAGEVAQADVGHEDAMAWWGLYRVALEQGDRQRLTSLLAHQARITIQVQEHQAAPQQFTLTPARFSQQLLMMSRFASRQQRTISAPVVSTGVAGEAILTVSVSEQRELFGVVQHQDDHLQITLSRCDGLVCAVQVRTESRIR